MPAMDTRKPRRLSRAQELAARLDERERELGLVSRTQSLAAATIAPTVPPASSASPASAVVGQPDQAPQTSRDDYGARIIGPVGALGQYVAVNPWDGRAVHVCGALASGAHVLAWSYHAGERRCVCGVCWPGLV